jgi:hypothetical protein
VTLPRLPARTQPRRITGTLVALEPVVLSVAHRGDTISLGLDSVLVLEVSRGRVSRERTTALAGAGLGLIAGFAIGQIAHPAAEDPGPREIIAITLIGGFVGTGLGVVVGREMRADRWERIR